jgi:hypothetical protein
MKQTLKIKVATALYEALADPGDCSYHRLSPTQKDAYERQAVAAYKAIKAALTKAE